jgi:hypothetical protein
MSMSMSLSLPIYIKGNCWNTLKRIRLMLWLAVPSAGVWHRKKNRLLSFYWYNCRCYYKNIDYLLVGPICSQKSKIVLSFLIKKVTSFILKKKNERPSLVLVLILSYFIFLFVAEKVQLKHVRVKRRTAIEWNSVTKQKLHMKRE